MSEMRHTNEHKCEVLERNMFEGYEYAIVSMGSHPCIYILIPEDNPFYELDYDDIPLDVHGRLTYSGMPLILNLSDDGCIRHDWWIGWDYAHSDDYTTIRHNSNGTIWTLNKLRREVKSAIKNLIELINSMNKDGQLSHTSSEEDLPSIYDMMDDIEYPDNELLVDGLKDGVMYSYVSNTYLNGFINYVTIIKAYMVNRYMDSTEWSEACKRIDSGDVGYHTDLSSCEKFDDIHILAVLGNSYIIFWSDRDCSDCCIGKVSKDSFNTAFDAIRAFDKYIEDIVSRNKATLCDDELQEFIKEIPTTMFHGWVTI